jgi:predicted permease
MPFLPRWANVFRSNRVNREIDEELQAHIEQAIEEGRDAEEARRAFGSVVRHREYCRDARIVTWLDSLRADAIFGSRQLLKRKLISATAILSLGLGIGACVSSFRLIDALLLRPLPITEPHRLYALSREEMGFDGKFGTFDGWAYPAFRLMRAAVKDRADLIAISYAERTDLTYGSDMEMEKAYLQYVSGSMFNLFGIQPALGRLFVESDDLEPGSHPYAVLSHAYWTARFQQDPNVIGRVFRLGNQLYEIIGVANSPFTGTEPGVMVDIFVPAMMNQSVTRPGNTWHRTLALLKPSVAVEPLRLNLDAISLAFERERARAFTNMSRQSIANYLRQRVTLEPAPSGISDVQGGNRRSLIILGLIVALVLLIACANVANLMTAQASARAREMGLRVSIGAGRLRLVQLLLVECAILASLAAAVGGFFAWWAASFVVRMINPPDNPVRLSLPSDLRVLAFGLVLTVVVILLFGLTPALRASAIRPAAALKGGENARSRGRIMHGLVAIQATFCFAVLFLSGLFALSFERLSHQPTGFSADRLLTLDTVSQEAQPAACWNQVAQHLSSVPGVEQVAIAGWPLLSGYGWNNSIAVNGSPPSDDLTYLLRVSPAWIETMKIPMRKGRDFLWADTYPGSAIVNETFVKRYFRDEEPIGRWFDELEDQGKRHRLRIVGIVADARYRGMRDAIPPIAYVPFHSIDDSNTSVTPSEAGIRRATFIVRTAGANPVALASTLRIEVTKARTDFHVSNIRSQAEINNAPTIRERLLAMLGLFFAGVALLLAGIGLYGVLDYSVAQRSREIGIRMAIGAPAGTVRRLVLTDTFVMLLLGAVGGLLLGVAASRVVEPLLYQVKSTDTSAIAIPVSGILLVSLFAALPTVTRAVRIDPAVTLRTE